MMIIAVLLMITGCDRDRRHPGWDYFPDMFYSNAYETFSPNENTPDGTTMLAPVEGTIPREVVPFPYGASLAERARAGKELVNPLEYSGENLAAGKQVYGVYCLSCHGDRGDGRGYLVTSGLYSYPVRTLVSDEVKGRPDGEIYHTITAGFGVMGAHGAQIPPEDRWRVVMYIKMELQDKE